MGEPWPQAGPDALRWGGAPSNAVEPVSSGLDLAPSALVLYAKVLSATTLQGAAHGLVAVLASDFGFARASIAVHEDGRTRLLASSNLDTENALAELPQRLLGAMDEAIEQGVSLAWPLTDDAHPDKIRFEQQALQSQVGGAVATVPLGIVGEVFGALCVERRDGLPIGSAELDRLERVMMLAVPALRWIHQGTQPWHQRVRREWVQRWVALRQPERRTTRRVLAGVGLVTFFLAVAPLEHDVSGRARVEGAEQRVLAAPTDGFVKTAHVRPGDRVRAGDALVDLLDGELRLERERWSSQLAQHENAYAAAMATSDRGAVSTSLARVSEAQAQLDLVDEQLVRGRVIAPFDALVIQGDLSQAIGAPVRQGDTLLTLATTGRYRVIIEIDEVDIAGVQPGQAGHMALTSLPWGREDLIVERIAPVAKAVDGRNVFEVEARLVAPRTDLRPGLLGRGDVVVGRMPPLWAWTRHALYRLRVAWWSWLG